MTPLWTPTPTQDANLSIGGIGIGSKMRGIFVDRPSGLGQYLFVHFHDEVQVKSQGKKVHVPGGSFVIWLPSAAHYFGSDGFWSHSWLYGSGSALRALVSSCGLPMEEPFRIVETALSDKYLHAMQTEIAGNARPDRQILVSYITIWLRELARRCRSPFPNPAQEQMLEIRRVIDNNPSAPYSLAQLAHMAALSVTHFSVRFKQQFGTSPMKYLLSVRMQRAQYYLHDRNLNITEVGRNVGFDNPYHFSKQFKRHFGVSPAHFRNQLGS